MNAEYRISLAPINDEANSGQVKEIFDNTKAQLNFLPNMYRIHNNIINSYV